MHLRAGQAKNVILFPVRNATWLLIQEDDGTLHVAQEAEYADGDRRKRMVPINDFVREGGPAPRHRLSAGTYKFSMYCGNDQMSGFGEIPPPPCSTAMVRFHNHRTFQLKVTIGR